MKYEDVLPVFWEQVLRKLLPVFYDNSIGLTWVISNIKFLAEDDLHSHVAVIFI